MLLLYVFHLVVFADRYKGIYWFYSTDKEGTEKKIVYTLLFLCSVLGYVRIGAGSDQTTVQLGILCACFSILLFGKLYDP